ANLFDSASAETRIARHFDVAALDGFGTFSRAELAAISAAIAYVEKTQIAARPPLQRPQGETGAATLFIDPATRANLELARTLTGQRQGSLLKAIDRTVTGGGARLIAERLMAPLTDPDTINRRLDSVTAFMVETRLRDDLRTALKQAPDMPRALSRLALGRGGPRDLGALADGFAAARTLVTLAADTALPEELREAFAAF
ncbi:MAG: DNA mismatch repair protein MutS, partial [Alphaproteobacteria bacterium]|nr:DNA mismatch repair protein MutS [Alphaproteobacteria bacterium]